MNGLTVIFIADLVLQVMSYVAQIERENIYKRQMEGIREAKKKGVHFLGKFIKQPDNFEEVAWLWKEGEIRLRDGATFLCVSHSIF